MRFILSLCLSYILTNQFIKWENPLEKLNYRRAKVKNSGGIVIALTSLFVSFLYLTTDFSSESLYFILGVATIAFVGLLDDVFGEGGPKGLKGHLLNLRSLHITTGFVKAIFAFILATVISILRGGPHFEIAIDILLITFSTNLLNLMDLRPGRACKFFLIFWAALMAYNIFKGNFDLINVFSPVAAATMIFFIYDAQEILMLGDAGANVLGLCLGLIIAWTVSMRYKILITTLILLLNLAAERYSFSVLIDKIPVLNYLDDIGRRRQWK